MAGFIDFSMNLNNEEDKLIQLLELEQQKGIESQMLRLERQKNDILQQGYDQLERKLLAVTSLLIEYKSKH